jgi:hypothetical protein
MKWQNEGVVLFSHQGCGSSSDGNSITADKTMEAPFCKAMTSPTPLRAWYQNKMSSL